MILVDSNVLIDVLDRDATWFGWSAAQLAESSRTATLHITPIIVAEVGPKFGSLAEFYAVLDGLMINVQPLLDAAAFVAGQAFRRHRQMREGSRSIVADFLIGGQAAVSGAEIVTRDPAIYARYFPQVPLISPTKAVS